MATREDFIKIYGLTEEEATIAVKCEQNANTKEGESMLDTLESLLNKRGGDTAVLYDLAADFDWDYDWSEEEQI